MTTPTSRSGSTPLRVLISGGGIGGATLAALLGRAGHRVVVVERDTGLRSSGNPVDVRGEAFGVVRALGLLPRLRAVATRVRRLVVVDDGGRPLGALPTQRGPDALEVPRADLCTAIVELARADADFRFGDSVGSIRLSGGRALVTCERSGVEEFDLVVGADGLHSRVRRLVFGPESDFVTPLGMYVATVPLAQLSVPVPEDAVLLHGAPGAATALHPGAGAPGVGFFLRSGDDVDVHDRVATDALLTRTYGGAGWRVPELLDAYLAADDTYFDAVCRVRTPSWSRGPVVLLGDAASCVSLFGEGSSAAVTGARTLARVLDSAPGVPEALRRYEREHRAVVRRGQRGAAAASRLLVPATTLGLRMRNLALRMSGRRLLRSAPA